MLKFFEVEKFYIKSKMTLYVDNVMNDAHLTIVYDRRIVARHTFSLYQYCKVDNVGQWLDLRKVDDAEKFLRRDCGELGSWIEEIQWKGARGQFDHAA